MELSSLSARMRTLYTSLSPERVFVVWMSLILGTLFLFISLIIMNEKIVASVPALGGSFEEGILGTPRFINPVLATTDQDKDLTALIFAGLMKRDANGLIVPDLAESVEKSTDGLKYTVTLKSWARFQDGVPVTADDVVYTISLIQDPTIKSTANINWEGIKAEKTATNVVTFTLKQPYPQFYDALTIGILPKHIWKTLNPEEISLSDYNIHAIGAGPFAIKTVTLNAGIPKSFVLTSNKYYTLGRPYLSTITIDTFQNEKLLLQAFNAGTISRVHGISPKTLASLNLKPSQILSTELPRTFTLFLNPNKAPFLADKDIRKALDLAIDKEAIVKSVYNGYARIANTPYPFDEESTASHFDPTAAQKLLSGSVYMKKHTTTPLEITIAIGNSDESRAIAQMIQANWQTIGVTAHIEIYEYADLNQNIIKDREFESVLTGTLVRHMEDLYAFWHSSQRKYPGLNISGYASSKLDKNLDTLRTETDETVIQDTYASIQKEFDEETPSIFLYTPSLIYAVKDSVTTPLPNIADDASSRFALIHKAYAFQEKIWKSTYNEKLITFINSWLH